MEEVPGRLISSGKRYSVNPTRRALSVSAASTTLYVHATRYHVCNIAPGATAEARPAG